jgi:hypothetical protein
MRFWATEGASNCLPSVRKNENNKVPIYRQNSCAAQVRGALIACPYAINRMCAFDHTVVVINRRPWRSIVDVRSITNNCSEIPQCKC